uniref:Putative ovule protein n=1 Tax=Solanum chacoense TaxID=4108 RepID=A0A0V0H2G2_SOLCH
MSRLYSLYVNMSFPYMLGPVPLCDIISCYQGLLFPCAFDFRLKFSCCLFFFKKKKIVLELTLKKLNLSTPKLY